MICAFNFALGSSFDGVFLFLLLFRLFVAVNGVDTAVVAANGVETAVNGTVVNGVDTAVNGVETAVVVSVVVPINHVEAAIVSVVSGVVVKNC